MTNEAFTHRTNDGRRIPLDRLEDSHLAAILPRVTYNTNRHFYVTEAERRGMKVCPRCGEVGDHKCRWESVGV